MNTVQEPLVHSVFPPPCSLPDSQSQDRSKDSHGAINSSAPELSPRRSVEIDPDELPERCQFTFSDGRQCTMARSDIHPALCRYHSEREDQLFGVPSPGGNVVGRTLDLPELYSACRDLTTAAGVNRALGQVFRLLAQRRISRQEAATFGYLAQLLLQTIHPISPPRKGDQQDALFAGNRVVPSEQRERGTSPQVPAPANKVNLKSGHPIRMDVPSKRPERGTSLQVPVPPESPAAATIQPESSPQANIASRGISPVSSPLDKVARIPLRDLAEIVPPESKPPSEAELLITSLQRIQARVANSLQPASPDVSALAQNAPATHAE